jgi:hypothetical protein
VASPRAFPPLTEMPPFFAASIPSEEPEISIVSDETRGVSLSILTLQSSHDFIGPPPVEMSTP